MYYIILNILIIRKRYNKNQPRECPQNQRKQRRKQQKRQERQHRNHSD